MGTEIKELDNPVLKMSNRLIEGRYNLTPIEQKVLIAMAAVISKNTKEFDKVKIRVKDLIEFCEIEETNGYKLVKSATKQLLKRTLEIQYANGDWFGTHWLQSAYYKHKDAVIEYEIDKNLKYDFLNLYKAYLATPAKLLIKFDNRYTPRLYNLLKKMIKVKDFEYEIEYFCDRFMLPESYRNKHTHFEKKFMKVCVDEINDKSDIFVEYKYIKEGRSYTNIHFSVTLKKNDNIEEKVEVQSLQSSSDNNDDKLYDEQQKIYDRLVNRGIGVRKAKSLVKKYELAIIERNLRYAVQQKDTSTNLPGLIITFIEQDIAGQNEKAKKEAKEREKERQKDRIQAYELFHGTVEVDKGHESEITTVSDELNDIEVEFIRNKGEKAGKHFIEKMERLGLTVDDVRAGKRK